MATQCLCPKNCLIDEVAYMGDDVNDIDHKWAVLES